MIANGHALFLPSYCSLRRGGQGVEIFQNKLCLCTVAFRGFAAHFLRILTCSFPEEPDILKTIEGLLWQTAWRQIRGLRWQADLKQPSSKPPEKISPHDSALPESWGFFVTDFTMLTGLAWFQFWRKLP
jgi:hypothetical protein